MKRTYFIILFVFVQTCCFGQRLERLYGNFNFNPIRNYVELGMVSEMFKYAAFGVYYTQHKNRHDLVGRVDNPYFRSELFDFSRLKDRVRGVTLLAGVSVNTKSDIDFHLMAGPHFGRFELHENVRYGEEYDKNIHWLESDLTVVNATGFAFRANILGAPAKAFGLNVGFIGNVNKYASYFRMTVGISLGAVRHLNQ